MSAAASIAVVVGVSVLVGLGTGLARKYLLLLVLSILFALIFEGLQTNLSYGLFVGHSFGDTLARNLLIAVITSSVIFLIVRAFRMALSSISANSASGMSLDIGSAEPIDIKSNAKKLYLIYSPIFLFALIGSFATPVVSFLMWLYFSRKSSDLKYAATDVFTFSVTWALALTAYNVFTFALVALGVPSPVVNMGIFLASLIPVVMAGYAMTQVAKGRLIQLPLNFRFIKCPSPVPSQAISTPPPAPPAELSV